MADIKKSNVLSETAMDLSIADKMMVNGTPTVFFDGEKDATKKRYLDVKVK